MLISANHQLKGTDTDDSTRVTKMLCQAGPHCNHHYSMYRPEEGLNLTRVQEKLYYVSIFTQTEIRIQTAGKIIIP